MATDTDGLIAAVRRQRLLPVLRQPSVEAAVARVRALGAAGCGVIELTTSTPGWDRALRETAGEELVVGLGTVSTADQATRAIEAGARFLVSPYPAPSVRGVAADADITFIEGGFTPGEIAAAAALGPAKVFPAHVGGPTFLKSILAVIPGAVVIPTGGIGVDEVDAYLAAGAAAVGIGSGLPSDPDALRRVFSEHEERGAE